MLFEWVVAEVGRQVEAGRGEERRRAACFREEKQAERPKAVPKWEACRRQDARVQQETNAHPSLMPAQPTKSQSSQILSVCLSLQMAGGGEEGGKAGGRVGEWGRRNMPHACKKGWKKGEGGGRWRQSKKKAKKPPAYGR